MKVRLVLLALLVCMVSLPTFGQLNGTYVVGPSAGADYTTFTAMVTDLEAVGIAGNVIFEIENGIYLEQIMLDGVNITGSSTFSITVKGQNLDRSLVILTFNNNTVADDHTIELDNIENVFIEHITFQNTTPGTSNKVMDIFNADAITIDQCRFIGVEATTISSNQACLTIESNSQNITINNTRFDDGSFGIRFSNSTSSNFNNNEFHNQFFEAITLSTTSDMNIEGNFITNDLNTSGQYKAININLTNDFIINRNRILVNSGLFGMLIQSTQAINNTSDLITNNHIHVNSTSATEGVIFFGADKIDFVNNTVVVSNGHANLNLDIITNGNIFNNVLMNFNDENVYEGGSLSTDFVTADFNNVYSSGSVTPDDELLSEHTTRTGLDANSISFDIILVDPNFPNVCHFGLNGAATVWPGVTTDIDGTVRDGTTPDIGAFEFILPTPEIFASNNISICAGEQITLEPQIAFVSYLWPDGSTNSSIVADADSTYVVQVVDAAGCLLSASVDVDLESISINLGDDLILCSDNVATLDAGNGFAAYLWSTGETSQQIEVSDADTYSVSVTNAIGCAASDQLTVTLSDDVLTPNFLVSSIGCPTDEIQFIEYSSVVPDAVSWDFGDGSSSNDPHPLHTYNALGNYEVTMTASIGDCSYSITKPVEITYECPWWVESHYPLDTAANDLSRNERDGEVNGGVTYVNDPLRGMVASFVPGNEDFIDLGFGYTPKDHNDEMTISLWMKTDMSGVFEVLISGSGGWYIGQGPGTETDLAIFYTQEEDNTQTWDHAEGIADNRWHNLVYTLSSGRKSVYVDGKFLIDREIPGHLLPSRNITIGRHNGQFGYTGLMDDIKLFNTALSEEQVEAEYLKSRSPLLLAYYPLDEDASDIGGNQYGGVPFNGGPSYVTDMERGKVALFDNDGFIGAAFDVPTTETTVSFWFKSDATDENMEMYKVVEELDNSGSSDQILSLNQGRAQHFLSGQLSTSITDYRDGQWHYISLSMGASVNGQRLRIDGGEQVAFGNVRASTLLDRKGINIGNTFTGYIDDVKIWSKIPSLGDVIKDYEASNKRGLLAHYTLDENADDISGQENHGTIVNDVTFVDDPVRGTVASFDGTGDYIDIPEVNPAREATISAWFNNSTTGAVPLIGSWAWGMAMEVEAREGGRFIGRGSNNDGSSTDFNAFAPTIPDLGVSVGTWHQATLTFNNGVLNAYIDGVFVGTKTSSVTGDLYYSGGTDWGIGRDNINAPHFMNGLLDDVKVWDRAQDAGEILAKYEIERRGFFGRSGGTIEEEYNLAVYPNPSTGIINYELTGVDTIDKGGLHIYDKTGHTIYSQEINTPDETTGQIDLTRFDNGLYIMMVASPRGKITSNFIIRH